MPRKAGVDDDATLVSESNLPVTLTMHVCIVIDATIPPALYGGTERVVYWLGKGLHQLGHHVTFLAGPDSRCEFAQIIALNPAIALDRQIPAGTDIVHLHSGTDIPHDLPFCQTQHGNTRQAQTFHPNTIFVSQSHASNHGATAFVHNGLDPDDYGPPDLTRKGGNLVFLAKAAWRVKNVRGAIEVARKAGKKLDIVGGHRLNFKMGFRLTLDWNCHFHGMLGGQDKNRLVQQAGGLVFPVRWPEPFGVAVIEALYFGLPVFATPYGALPELVDAASGFLSTSCAELAEQAARADHYDRPAIHATWQERFTHLHMAKKYLNYYEQILSGQDLHPALIHAPAVRGNDLLEWTR